MKCPVCRDATLSITERQGIEIDYCPECRGVWLDRGELDKIIDRTAQDAPPPRMQNERPYSQDYDQRSHGYPKHRKRKSLLGELFDF
ncbi:MAG TPA: zf-TFIIB domain-containing protein [Gammaproteobacteria bacterium]